ncbi:MAG: hydroxymethylbilane synthase [Actinomycetaceae bacterium]|nr:hydroxymethylbilane synthase [Actinomycetaceae bacterium]
MIIGSTQRPLRIGTRNSALARVQSESVARYFENHGINTELVLVTTPGDSSRASLASLGGYGVFASTLRQGLVDHQCDIAVHSAKDLPAHKAPLLEVVSYPKRENTDDVLIARDNLKFHELPQGARIGTGSPRRAGQLRHLRPDLEIVDIRGNVPTRIKRVKGIENIGDVTIPSFKNSGPSSKGIESEKTGDLDGIVLAYAGLHRLGLDSYITDTLGSTIVCAAAQGALAIEVHEDFLTNAETHNIVSLLRKFDHLPTHIEVRAEQTVLEALQAGCSAPVGVEAKVKNDKNSCILHLHVCIAHSHFIEEEIHVQIADSIDTLTPLDVNKGIDASRTLVDKLRSSYDAMIFTDLDVCTNDSHQHQKSGQ